MVTNRNLTAISFALTASKIAKPAPTRTRGDSKLVLSKIFRSIEEVVDYCSSGEATINKVADKLMWILHNYETSRDIEIHQMEQAGGNFERELAGDIPERLQVEEQPGDIDHERLRDEDQRVRTLTLDHLEQYRATSNYKIYSFLFGMFNLQNLDLKTSSRDLIRIYIYHVSMSGYIY